ncbi:uncharacterized protein N7459_003676 [Penicillium hispanicum]|uniref:uncharacterized protein n=1 Tax=Penicillium hispanicum TaxID=1080232 RepID=UPI00254262A7|nr:uncharacterized protein N7459_003676 [Penicillium hispanicum]KAJ5587911.1 hypothetical protein N7459_003676 [Penicillium hispanicum]
MPSTYTPLSKLPLDCWLLILEYLPSKDLEAVSRVSWEIRASSEPFLYRHVSFDWRTVPCDRLLKLLRTIHQRPELSACIEEVTFVSARENEFLPYRTLNWRSRLNTSEYGPVLGFCISIVEQGKFPYLRFWKNALRTASGYAFAAILISQLINLQTLQLDCSFVLEGGYTGLMMKHAMLSAPPGVLSDFARLKVVDYGSNSARLKNYAYSAGWMSPNASQIPNWDTEQFVGWFFVPSLRVLSMWARTPRLAQDIAHTTSIKRWNLHRLRVLQLPHSAVRVSDLNFLLPYMRSLGALHLGLHFDSPGLAWKSSRDLQPGLRGVSATLNKLSLNPQFTFRRRSNGLEDAIWYVCPQEQMRLEPGFLRDFPKLRCIHIPFSDATGWGTQSTSLACALPPLIEEIHIRDCMADLCLPGRRGDEILDSLEQFLVFHAARFPHLRRIVIYVVYLLTLSDYFTQMHDHVCQLGQQKGIRIEFLQPDGRSIAI